MSSIKKMVTVKDIMRVKVNNNPFMEHKGRFLLIRTDQGKQEFIGDYELIRHARTIAIDNGYESYIIYDALEDRTLIEYSENE